jgi:hypothetical protein
VQNAEVHGDNAVGEHQASCERNHDSTNASAKIARRIVTELSPVSVVDTGGAGGALVEKLRELDVDARTSRGSRDEPRDGKADLVVCAEAREQTQAPDAERLIESLCDSADRILFSPPSADTGANAPDVRRPEDWSALFARHDFFRNVDFDASFLGPVASLYERSDALPEIVRAHDRSWWRLGSNVRERDAENLRLREELLVVRDDLIGHEARLGEALGRIELLEADLGRHREAVAAAERLLGTRTGRLLRAWHRLRALLRA